MGRTGRLKEEEQSRNKLGRAENLMRIFEKITLSIYTVYRLRAALTLVKADTRVRL